MIDLISRIAQLVASTLDVTAIKAVTDLLPDAGALTSISSETDKIDSAAIDGLSGVEDSLAYEAQELCYHSHNNERWYGKDPGDTFLLADGQVSWQLTAGVADYGNWVQLSNGDEIAQAKYDPHKILVTASSAANEIYYIQLGTGEAGAQVAVTTIAIFTSASIRQSAVLFLAQRVANTTKLWARTKCTSNGATINFLLGAHSYPG